MTKVIDTILYIDKFEQHFLGLNCMLQSSRIKYHMKTIGISQSLSNSSSFENNCLNNVENIYQYAGKCDDQQKCKDILEAAMVSNPE